jgi:hypothetical protein
MTPEWHDDALDQLADIWVAATPADRERIEKAVAEINRMLGSGPQFLGESRGGYDRAWFHPPLVIRFRVLPNQPAKVQHVAPLRRHFAEPDGPDS